MRNPKFEIIIEILLILLLIFTPLAFGSQVFWAYSLMELGILLVIILWAVQRLSHRSPTTGLSVNVQSEIRTPKSEIASNPRPRITHNYVLITVLLLSLFLGLVLLQMTALPGGIIKIISPKAYALRSQLSVIHPVTSNQSPITNNQSLITTLSFYPYATRVELLKWLSLSGLFIFLLQWKLTDNRYRVIKHLIYFSWESLSPSMECSNSSAAAATSSIWIGQDGSLQSRGLSLIGTALRAIFSWSSR
jgi:hypothetical protein